MKHLSAIRISLFALLCVGLAKAQNTNNAYYREHPEERKRDKLTFDQIVLAQDSLPPDSLLKIFDFDNFYDIRQYLKKKGFKYKSKPKFAIYTTRRRRGYTLRPTFTSKIYNIYILYHYSGSYSVEVEFKPEYYWPNAMLAYLQKFETAGFVKQSHDPFFFNFKDMYINPNKPDIMLLGPYQNNGPYFSLVYMPQDTVSTLNLTAYTLVNIATCPKADCITDFVPKYSINESWLHGYSNADKVYHINNYSYKIDFLALDSSYLYLSVTTDNVANYDTLLKSFTEMGFTTNTTPHKTTNLLNWEDVYKSDVYPGITVIMGARTNYKDDYIYYQTHYYINLRRGEQ